MSAQQSFADDMVEGLHRLSRGIGGGPQRRAVEQAARDYAIRLRRATRFVVDDDLVMQTMRVARKTPADKLVDRLSSAALPFDSIWIEYNTPAYARAVEECLELRVVPPARPRCGFLLTRDKHDPALWEATGSGLLGYATQNRCDVPAPMTYFLKRPGTAGISAWYDILSSDKQDQTHRKVEETASIILWDYDSDTCPEVLVDRVGVKITPAIKDHLFTQPPEAVADTCQNVVWAHRGVMRWLVTLVATLNDVPTLTSDEVQPTGRRMVGGSDKPFLSYRRLTLHLPKNKDPVRYINRKLDHAVAARKRAHDVRGHWRNYHLVEGCEHTWQQAEEDPTYRRCTSCGAFSRFIAEHVRGDASLGWVKKEYVLAGEKT